MPSQRGDRAGARGGFRKARVSGRCYLKVWPSTALKPPVESRGHEKDIVAEFHRLRLEGRVLMLEMGSAAPADRGPWLSWSRPSAVDADRPPCPHCGK